MFLPGAVALWLAFVGFVGSTYFYFRSVRGKEGARSLGRQFYALGVFGIVVASLVLAYLIVTHDFRLHYVFSYSDRSLPFSYLIATFWAGQEGSFLLWLLWGSLIGIPLIRYARHYEDRALVVYNLTLLSLVVILLRQSPFRFLEGLPPGQAPFDGQGLNPLLQNPWMTIHPPIMFLGYAATAVPFAFAVAALWGRRYNEWVRASLPWALVTVVTLGCAILLGGYWAYVTLGWGGYWGWDPVENSSLVPWLASVALVHGMVLQKARGRFRKLNFSLAILGYVLVVYATFLTRSGVLADFSVHSFVDLGITGWLVANLGIFMAIGFGAMLWRWREIPTEVGDEPFFSRTVFFILAIAALLGTAAVVLVGTSSPLITRLAAQPAQVKPAFYNHVTLPVGVVLAALLALVPYLHWRGTSRDFRGRLLLAAGLSVAAAAGAIVLGATGILYVAFLLFAVFAFFSNLFKTIEEVRARRIRAAGGWLAHVGLGLMLAGIITSSAYDRSQKVVLPLNEGKQVFGYTLTFRGIERPTPRAREAMLVEVRDGDGHTYMARPHMFRSKKSNQLVANPDVRAHLTRDLYISPIEFDPGRPPDDGSTVDLGKGETRKIGPYALTFDDFEMAGMHGENGQISVGAHLTIRGPHGTQELTPMLRSGENGLEAEPLDLANATGVAVRLVGVDAGEGKVRIQMTGAGAGIAQRATLREGETLTYKGAVLTFDGFDLSNFDPEAGKINIGATFKVTGPNGVTSEVTPMVRGGRTSQTREDAAIPGLDGVLLRIGTINAEGKTVEAIILDPSAPPDQGVPARFSVDFTVKPMIGLLWSGLLVLLVGGIMSVVRRGEEFTQAAEAQAVAR